jgi:hypothetical protein
VLTFALVNFATDHFLVDFVELGNRIALFASDEALLYEHRDVFVGPSDFLAFDGAVSAFLVDDALIDFLVAHGLVAQGFLDLGAQYYRLAGWCRGGRQTFGGREMTNGGADTALFLDFFG